MLSGSPYLFLSPLSLSVPVPTVPEVDVLKFLDKNLIDEHGELPAKGPGSIARKSCVCRPKKFVIMRCYAQSHSNVKRTHHSVWCTLRRHPRVGAHVFDRSIASRCGPRFSIW